MRGYLSGSGWKEYRDGGHGLRGHAARPGLVESDRIDPHLHPGHQGRDRATTRTSPSTRMAAAVGGEQSPRRCGGRAWTSTATAAELRPVRGADPGRHEVRVRRDSTTTGELLLVDEVLTPDSSRYWPVDATSRAARSPRSTSSSSATGSRRPAGTRPAPPRPARRRGGEDPRKVHRRLRDPDRPALPLEVTCSAT